MTDDVGDCNRRKMREKINSSTSTLCRQYRDYTNVEYNDVIYGQFMSEFITKCRLSCHTLHIKTGRYTSPKTPRDERICGHCNCIEDEHHALFDCPLYGNVRMRFRDFLLRLPSVKQLLNPSNINDANTLGDMLIQIEDVRRSDLWCCVQRWMWKWIVKN